MYKGDTRSRTHDIDNIFYEYLLHDSNTVACDMFVISEAVHELRHWTTTYAER